MGHPFPPLTLIKTPLSASLRKCTTKYQQREEEGRGKREGQTKTTPLFFCGQKFPPPPCLFLFHPTTSAV